MRRSLTVFLLIAFAGCNGGGAPSTGTLPSPLAQIRAHRADSPIFLKGVNYAPSPICSGPLDNPLGNKNRAVWKRDLPLLRSLGVNAIKVYNANPKAEPIGDFLTEAYNNGNKPIYVILSIFFPTQAPLNKDAVNDLSGQYRSLAQVNGVYPAVIGMSISAEVNDENVRDNPAWWNGMSQIARAAKDGFKLSGHPEKFITTTMVDDGFKTEKQGEKYNFPVDVWGVNFYRGETFGVAFSDYRKVSSKPLIVSEWGTPASWHPNGNPNKAEEFPKGKVHLLTSYVGGLAKEIGDNSLQHGGVAMGGFYFEYTDEWWKAGDQCIQLPSPEAPNEKYPGGYGDEAWFGLNSIAAGTPNVLTQRPTFDRLKEVFAGQ